MANTSHINQIQTLSENTSLVKLIAGGRPLRETETYDGSIMYVVLDWVGIITEVPFTKSDDTYYKNCLSAWDKLRITFESNLTILKFRSRMTINYNNKSYEGMDEEDLLFMATVIGRNETTEAINRLMIRLGLYAYYSEKYGIQPPSQSTEPLTIEDYRAHQADRFKGIKDLATKASDYTKNAENGVFFAHMNNLLLWAVCKSTAPEIKYLRANALLENMGLKTFGTNSKEPNKTNVQTSVNYLDEDEMKRLARLTDMVYISVEEFESQGGFTLREFITTIKSIIHMLRREVLMNDYKSKYTPKEATQKVEQEFEEYRQLLLSKISSNKQLPAQLKLFDD